MRPQYIEPIIIQERKIRRLTFILEVNLLECRATTTRNIMAGRKVMEVTQVVTENSSVPVQMTGSTFHAVMEQRYP